MQLINLKDQYRRLEKTINERMTRVFEHGQFIMGPEVSELEQALADFVGVEHCVAVSSGTDALVLALMSLEIGPGDEVITTPFSFVATAEAIVLLGAKPIFVDICFRTLDIDPQQVENAITQIKNIAKYHTASNDNNGVAIVLERLVIALS